MIPDGSKQVPEIEIAHRTTGLHRQGQGRAMDRFIRYQNATIEDLPTARIVIDQVHVVHFARQSSPSSQLESSGSPSDSTAANMICSTGFGGPDS